MAELWMEKALAEIHHCNKCGFCLPACPTYRLTGNEVDSPRGRIALVEGVLNNEIAADEGLSASLSYCLGCRACETACPSGVQYHRVLEAGKKVLDRTKPGHRQLTWVPRTLLKLTRQPKRLKRLAALGRRTAHWPLPSRLKALAPMLDYREESIQPVPPAPQSAPPAFFFHGCVQEALFHDANDAAKALLSAAGYRVEDPPQQACCGALLWHAGREEEARDLARRNIVAFEQGAAPVVNTAGGCGAMLKSYPELFDEDPAWRERAERFAARVSDWLSLLEAAPHRLEYQGTGERVVLQNSCHLVNVEGGGERPGQMLGAVAGDTYVPLAGQDRCCGSAGIYNIQHPEWALQLLDQKMDEVAQAQPTRVVVVNPGCALQMTLGVKRSHLNAEVEHLARYLYRAFLRAQGQTERGHQVG
ncbi:MAG: heterodisulfide reductase-related iron-sulfur binding cluster [Firmicutes bacterium]|nr:heterodisulfide reductase-related iron-sulfur binding cluster [Bacillota bacterium]